MMDKIDLTFSHRKSVLELYMSPTDLRGLTTITGSIRPTTTCSMRQASEVTSTIGWLRVIFASMSYSSRWTTTILTNAMDFSHHYNTYFWKNGFNHPNHCSAKKNSRVRFCESVRNSNLCKQTLWYILPAVLETTRIFETEEVTRGNW